jgi:hypothetical protein
LKALEALPWGVFEELRGVVREALSLAVARVGRWLAFGLDGSKQNLPRTTANIARYKANTRGPATAQGLVVAAFALGRKVLWDWEWAAVEAGERKLALPLAARLPARSLVVTDAGFVGFEWLREVLRGGKHVLLRVGANCRLWAEEGCVTEWRDGEVLLWPEKQQEAPPLQLRLLKLERVVCRKRKGGKRRKGRVPKQVVWLLTDVLREEDLSRQEAGEIFQRRWGGNEVGFRSWKRTLGAGKLLGRTPARAQREAELTLLGLQLLEVLVLRARARRQERRREKKERGRVLSVAGARRIWRWGRRSAVAGNSTRRFAAELSAAVVDDYRRRKPKVKSRWPERKEHKSPGNPKLRRLPKRLKLLWQQLLAEAAG